MIQKAAKMRLFAFKTSHPHFRSASAPLLLRSAEICTFAVPSEMGLFISPQARWPLNY